MVYQEDVGGIPDAEWVAAVGWIPLRGSAAGFITDLFLEFSWGALLFCYLLGRFYGALWRKAATLGGVWTLLFIEAAALSVYIPTQSVSAVFHRFLFMTIPTLLLWKLMAPHDSGSKTAGAVVHYRMEFDATRVPRFSTTPTNGGKSRDIYG
jgi:hypothetical protein